MWPKTFPFLKSGLTTSQKGHKTLREKFSRFSENSINHLMVYILYVFPIFLHFWGFIGIFLFFVSFGQEEAPTVCPFLSTLSGKRRHLIVKFQKISWKIFVWLMEIKWSENFHSWKIDGTPSLQKNQITINTLRKHSESTTFPNYNQKSKEI
jgi:hypothetical protein